MKIQRRENGVVLDSCHEALELRLKRSSSINRNRNNHQRHGGHYSGPAGYLGRKAKRQPESQKLLVSGWPQSSAEKAEFIIPAASPSCCEEDEDLTNPNSYYNAIGRRLSKSRLRFRSGLTKTNAAFDIDFTKHSRKPGTATQRLCKEQCRTDFSRWQRGTFCLLLSPGESYGNLIALSFWANNTLWYPPSPSVLLWGSLSSNGVS